jgi:hypothetical protein
MTRYFFDLKGRMSVEHDYTGRQLSTLEQAGQLANLIAMDLSCTRLDDAVGMEVQIRTSDGALLSSVPVRPIDSLAA